jgi:hypothetical protein
MGRGIDRTGPGNEYFITSNVTLLDQYSYEDDPEGDLWMDDIDNCISYSMGDKWKKPKQQEWIRPDSWSRREYYVLARHEGVLDAAIVASTDADGGELFVTVKLDRCDNPGMEKLAEGMVHIWCQKLREALKPMSPKAATSAWTRVRIFEEEKEAA